MTTIPDSHLREDLLLGQDGYTWGQALFTTFLDRPSERLALLDKAMAQGEPLALLWRAIFEWSECGNLEGAAQFLGQGAELGDAECQYHYALKCFARGNLAQLEWLRLAAIQGQSDSWSWLVLDAEDFVACYDGGGSGREVYEIGAAFADDTVKHEPQVKEDKLAASERAVALYRRWNEEAKRAVMCWLWLAREKNVVKDIRVLVANLVWDGRAAWSERCVSPVV